MQKPKLAILIPTWSEFVHYKFALSLRNLEIPMPWYIAIMKGLPIHVARQELVEEALSMGVDYILFLDSDIVIYDKFLIHKMLKWRYPIVSALYTSKQQTWCAYVKKGDKYLPIKKFPEVDFVIVDATGLGCCLIEARVFEKIKERCKTDIFFKWDTKWKYSEDLYFFDLANKAGFKVLIPLDCKVTHVATGELIQPWKLAFEAPKTEEKEKTIKLKFGEQF